MQIKVMCVVCGNRFGVDEFNPRKRYACQQCRTVPCSNCRVRTITLADAPDGRNCICIVCAEILRKDYTREKSTAKKAGDVAKSTVQKAAALTVPSRTGQESSNIPSNVPAISNHSRDKSRRNDTGRPEYCANCSAQVIPGSRFCNTCGQQLVPNPSTTTACPDCKNLISLDAPSCPHCGTGGPFYPRDGQKALLRAINGGDVAMVATLLGQGDIDVNVNLTPAGDTITTPLDAAEAWGQHAVVKLLVRLGGERGEPDCPMDDISVETVDAISALVQSHVRRHESPTISHQKNAPGMKVNRQQDRPARKWRKLPMVCLSSGILVVLSAAIEIYLQMIQEDHSSISQAEVFWTAVLIVAFSILSISAIKLAPRPDPNDRFKNYLRLSDRIQPILKTIVSILLFAAGVWLIGAAYCIYSGFEAGPETGSGQMGFGVLNAILAIIALAIISIPMRLQCPNCHRWLAAVLQSSHLIDRSFETESVMREERHYNTRGDHVGSTKRQDQQVVTVEKHLNGYECRYCQHEWTGISITRS